LTKGKKYEKNTKEMEIKKSLKKELESNSIQKINRCLSKKTNARLHLFKNERSRQLRLERKGNSRIDQENIVTNYSKLKLNLKKQKSILNNTTLAELREKHPKILISLSKLI
jgi:hypothetical protein